MSENPKWSSLLSNHNQVKRRRIDSLQPDAWNPPDRACSKHSRKDCKSVRVRRTDFDLELSKFSPLIHDDEVPNINTNNDISLAISDNPDNGVSSDNEHDIVVIESDSSDNNKENEEIQGENISRHEDLLGFAFSSDSDGGNEESHEDQVLVKPFAKREVNTKLDCFISAVGDIPHMMEPLELPSKKELRTPLSSRLATLVRRVRSDKVVRLHTHANDSNADNTRAQVFTTNSVFLPSASRSIRGHVVVAVVDGDILLIPTTLIGESQFSYRRELTFPGLEQQQKRIIFSPNAVSVQEIPREISIPTLRRILLLCDCIQKDPTGNAWHSCSHRFGCGSTKRSTVEQLCASGGGQLHFFVLQKSLLWFQKRLKIAFLVKLSNGSLSMLLLPSSVCRQWPRDGGDESSTSSRMTVVSTMDPGCVYSVKTLPVVTTASDAGLTKKARKMWSRLPNFLKCDERLAQFVSSNDAPDELDLFVLKKAAKFHLVLEMTAFSETTFFLPYSPLLSSSSRCVLTGVLLYEFPSGSLIAERILAGNRGTLTDNEDQLSTVFAISSESTPSQGTVYLVLCSANAVTPLTLLISSDHLSPCATLDYGQHRSYRVRLFIVGAIVAHGLFILDAFSRVDLTEVARLPERPLDHTRGHQWPGFAGAFRDRKASLITMAGTVMDVDSSSSQVWPLCTGCLSDALKQKASTSNPSTTHLECSRCEARIDRPFHAVEIFVEVTDKVQQRRFKVCILPSCFAEMLKLSEAQIHQSSFLDPGLLIGQAVNIPLGLSIKLPELEASQVPLSDCQNVVIQLHPNMLT
ncbi:conserved hypothetical protein [Echinococcus multilocularis]|uniref:DUF4503 domain-containing protein n=1 Tax=Echinococcus multilocularis TaxID=6211 RepID=A0A087VXY5_ECHMU|nr:conserved hypothetical protein [Echinococcus multilocularis]